MHDTLFRAVTAVCDFWQNLALAALIFTVLRQRRRIAAVERHLHRERQGTTVVTIHQPPPSVTMGGTPVVYRYDGVQG